MSAAPPSPRWKKSATRNAMSAPALIASVWIAEVTSVNSVTTRAIRGRARKSRIERRSASIAPASPSTIPVAANANGDTASVATIEAMKVTPWFVSNGRRKGSAITNEMADEVSPTRRPDPDSRQNVCRARVTASARRSGLSDALPPRSEMAIARASIEIATSRTIPTMPTT